MLFQKIWKHAGEHSHNYKKKLKIFHFISPLRLQLQKQKLSDLMSREELLLDIDSWFTRFS